MLLGRLGKDDVRKSHRLGSEALDVTPSAYAVRR